MRLYLIAMVTYLAMVGFALGAVGDGGIPDDPYAIQPYYQTDISPHGIVDQSNPYSLPQISGPVMPFQGGYPGSSEAEVAYNPIGSPAMPYNMPAGAPKPPDPNTENLVLPDFNTINPTTGLISYPYQGNIPIPSSQPISSSYSPQGCPSSTDSKSIPGSYPIQGNYPSCSASSGFMPPSGYSAQNYQAVYPKLSTCRCNEYYVQVSPGKLGVVGGTRCGNRMPIWSKISRPGIYWSYEWIQCGNPQGYFCNPDIKNFGYKGPGWIQTWFLGNMPGWHILSYYCNDWSNYIYIYVWPPS